MGVDIYMQWDGMTEADKEAQITGFVNTGSKGYLRGAYFGGLSDVLYELFAWADWQGDPMPFSPTDYRNALSRLIAQDGERPDKGKWDYSAGTGWDFSERQNEPVPAEIIQEYRDFLDLAERLIREGKNPMVVISA